MDEATEEILEEITETTGSGLDKTQALLLLIVKELRELNTNLSSEKE